MKIFKKIIFPFFSIFLGYSSVEILISLDSSAPADLSNIESFTVAFLFTLYVTGFFAFIGFAYPTSKIASNNYYKIYNPKALVIVSNILGIKHFQVLLLITFWGSKKNRKKYFNGTKKGLQNFIFQTKQSEFGHLGGFIVISISSIFLLLNHYFLLVSIITLINIFGNFYPILLQRTHRIRIEKITKKIVN